MRGIKTKNAFQFCGRWNYQEGPYRKCLRRKYGLHILSLLYRICIVGRQYILSARCARSGRLHLEERQAFTAAPGDGSGRWPRRPPPHGFPRPGPLRWIRKNMNKENGDIVSLRCLRTDVEAHRVHLCCCCYTTDS